MKKVVAAFALLSLVAACGTVPTTSNVQSEPSDPNGFLAKTRTDKAITEGMALSCKFTENGNQVKHRFLSAKFDDRLLDNVLVVTLINDTGARYSTLIKEAKSHKAYDGKVYASTATVQPTALGEKIKIDNYNTAALSDFTGVFTAGYIDVSTKVSFERQNGKVTSLDLTTSLLKKGGFLSFGQYNWEEQISVSCR